MRSEPSNQQCSQATSRSSLTSTQPGSTVRGWASLRTPGALSKAMQHVSDDTTTSEAMPSPWDQPPVVVPQSAEGDVEGGRGLWRAASKHFTGHEHVYHWRARRWDIIAGVVLFLVYTVAAVLLFLLPCLLHR